MTSEDFEHSMVVTKTAKRLAWLMVIVINLYFVYFTVLRGITRSTSWQTDYMLACIFQLFVEVLVYETGECLWIHFTIPKLVSEEVATTMNTVKHAINIAFMQKQTPTVLNSPKYFFISRQLAEEFPHLFESSVVLAFHSYFPPSDLDTTTAVQNDSDADVEDSSSIDVGSVPSWNTLVTDLDGQKIRRHKKRTILMTFVQRFNMSVLVLSILQHLGTVPIRFQQVIIHTLQPILFSFVIILFFYLLKYPMMSLLPMGFILYEAVMYAYRKNDRRKKVSAINDVEKHSRQLNADVISKSESPNINRKGHPGTKVTPAPAVDEDDDDDDEDDDTKQCHHCGQHVKNVVENEKENDNNVYKMVDSTGKNDMNMSPSDASDSDSDSEEESLNYSAEKALNIRLLSPPVSGSTSRVWDTTKGEGTVQHVDKDSDRHAWHHDHAREDEDESERKSDGHHHQGISQESSTLTEDPVDKMNVEDFIQHIADSDDEEEFIVDPQKAVDYFEENFFSADHDVPDPGKHDPVLAQHKALYDQSEKDLIFFLVNIKGENPENFEYGFDENSDEYRYLYKPKIAPFVDKWGFEVNMFQIMAKRDEMMQKDIILYDQKAQQAQQGMERRRQAGIVWDTYRLYDSEVVLPFIDSQGKFISPNCIRELRTVREQVEKYPDITGPKEQKRPVLHRSRATPAPQSPSSFSFSLSQLYKAKQLAEYNLMIYEREALQRHNTEKAGDMFLTAYRRKTQQYAKK